MRRHPLVFLAAVMTLALAFAGCFAGATAGAAKAMEKPKSAPPVAPKPNQAPIVAIATIVPATSSSQIGVLSGDIIINYTIQDTEADLIDLAVELSTDGGQSYLAAPATANGGDGVSQLESSPSGKAHVFQWDSRRDLSTQAYDQVVIRITPRQGEVVGQTIPSDPFKVDNNDAPIAEVDTPSGATLSDFVTVTYRIKDPNADPANVVVKYSTNGFKSAFIATEQREAIPDSADLDGDGDTTEALPDVNDADGDGDTAEALPDVNDDDGDGDKTEPATRPVSPSEGIKALTTAADGALHTFVWDTKADLGAKTFAGVQLRITPSDNKQGSSGQTDPVTIANNAAPEVLDLSVQGIDLGVGNDTVGGEVTIEYTLRDSNSDPVTLVVEYSFDGATFFTATPQIKDGEAHQTQNLRSSPEGVPLFFRWNTIADLGLSLRTQVTVRLTPSDAQDSGVAVSSPTFKVDNNTVPGITLTKDFTGVVEGEDVVVLHKLRDANADRADLEVEYSFGGAAFQSAASDTVSLINQGKSALATSPGGIPTVFVWDALASLGRVRKTDVKLRLRPKESADPTQVGDWVETPTFEVNTKTPPTLALASLSGTASGDTSLTYYLYDNESDACSLQVEFSADGGATWTDDPLTGTKEGGPASQGSGGDALSNLSSSPTGVTHTYVWNTLSDIGVTVNSTVRLRFKATDSIVGEWVLSSTLKVDNSSYGQTNQPPIVIVSPIALAGGTPSGNIELNYRIADADMDFASVVVEYSINGGDNWLTATETRQLPPDVNDLDGDSNTTEPTPDVGDLDGDGDTTENLPDVNDNDNDGNTTEDATVPISPSEGVKGLATAVYPGTAHKFVWDSVADLGKVARTGVLLRVTPTDKDGPGGGAGTPGFPVDNNLPPSVTIDNPGTVSGDVVITYHLSDAELNNADVVVRYSTNGVDYFTAARKSGTEGVTGLVTTSDGSGAGTHTFTWASKSNLAPTRYANVTIQITPSDLYNTPGTVGTSAAFTVDNNDAPVMIVSTPSGVQTGVVNVSIEVRDTNSDPVSFVPEYSTDGATYLAAATASGSAPTSGLASSPTGKFYTWKWDAPFNLPHTYSSTVTLRFTPSDAYASGAAVTTANFTLDTTTPPSITAVTTPTGTQGSQGAGVNVTIPYTIADPESQAASLFVEWSIDNGLNWATASEGTGSDGTSGLSTSPGGTNHSFVWNSADTGNASSTQTLVRITPSDSKQGFGLSTNAFTLDNSGLVNTPPTASTPTITPAGLKSGDVTISFTLTETDPADEGTLEVAVQFIGGTVGSWSWCSTTPARPITGLGSGTRVITWHSNQDVPDQDATNFQVRVQPKDQRPGGVGAWKYSATFTLDNLAPAVTLTDPNGLQLLKGGSTKAITWNSVETNKSTVKLSYYRANDWSQATATAGWSARRLHGSVGHNGKLWVLGGFDGSTRFNDVWSSSDGATWTQATATAGWSARYGHASVSYKGKLWVIGGHDLGDNKNDVWSSPDGVTWTQVTSAAPWAARVYFTAVVFNNKIWVLGGQGTSAALNDVWSSADGATWTQATASAGWSARVGHGAASFAGKLWVMGGTGFNGGGSPKSDVWSSTDGVTWTQNGGPSGWSARAYFGTAVFNSRLWVLGGLGSSARLGDVYSSGNGVSWLQESTAAPWAARDSLAGAVFDDKLWISGGWTDASGANNDVWSFPGAATTIAASTTDDGSHSWTVPNVDNGDYRVQVVATDQVGQKGNDASDNDFEIDSTPPTVTVTAPNGGEVLTAGAATNITFTVNDKNMATVDIRYATDGNFSNGANIFTIVTGLSVSSGAQVYSWTPPSSAVSSTVKVEVKAYDAVGFSTADESNANFTIQASTKTYTYTLTSQSDFAKCSPSSIDLVTSPGDAKLGRIFTASWGQIQNYFCLDYLDADSGGQTMLLGGGGGLALTNTSGQFVKVWTPNTDPALYQGTVLGVKFFQGDSSGKTFLFGTAYGAYLTKDGGATFRFWNTNTQPSLPHNVVRCVAFYEPDGTGKTFVLGTDGGAALTTDGGNSFKGFTTGSSPALPDNQVLAADFHEPPGGAATFTRLGLGTMAGLALTRDGGQSFTVYGTGAGFESDDVTAFAFHDATSTGAKWGVVTQKVSSNDANLDMTSDDGGSFFVHADVSINLKGGDEAYGFEYHEKNAGGSVVYLATNNGLLYSTNPTNSQNDWQVKKSDSGLPGNNIRAVATHNGGSNDNRAGCATLGGAAKSFNDAGNWQMMVWANIDDDDGRAVAFHPGDATGGTYLIGHDWGVTLVKGGTRKHFHEGSSPQIAGNDVRAVAFSAVDVTGNTWAVATNRGVSLTTDGGANFFNWQPGGLPSSDCFDLAFHNTLAGRLIVATDGGVAVTSTALVSSPAWSIFNEGNGLSSYRTRGVDFFDGSATNPEVTGGVWAVNSVVRSKIGGDPQGRIHITTNNGGSFSQLQAGGGNYYYKCEFLNTPATSGWNTLAVDRDSNNGTWVTKDSGASWTQLTNLPSNTTTQLSWFHADTAGNTFMVATNAGAALTLNGGTNYFPVNTGTQPPIATNDVRGVHLIGANNSAMRIILGMENGGAVVTPAINTQKGTLHLFNITPQSLPMGQGPTETFYAYDRLKLTATYPGGTSAKVRFYESAGTLLSDSVVPGNAAGLAPDGSGYVAMSAIPKATYPSLQIGIELASTINTNTPVLNQIDIDFQFQ